MGSILASISWPFWYQLGSILDFKIHEKSMPRGFQDASFFWSILVSISNAFWLRFGGQLASNLGPKTRQDGARSRPGGVQNRVKMELPSQDAPETDLDAILDGFWERFGRIFDRFWINVCLIFDTIWDGFLIDFWKRFGKIFCRFPLDFGSFFWSKICLLVPSMFHIPRASAANERAQRAMWAERWSCNDSVWTVVSSCGWA